MLLMHMVNEQNNAFLQYGDVTVKGIVLPFGRRNIVGIIVCKDFVFSIMIALSQYMHMN
jgi:hypothetical protein